MKEKTKDISKKVKPLADRIVIRERIDDKEQKTASGIIIPGAAEDRYGRRGVVVAVGPGRVEDGKTVKASVAVGDAVVFQYGDKVSIDREEYYIVRESEILAIIK